MIIIYLIKSTLCLGILFGFYKIALEGKAMHQFKRIYLLASLLFAFTIPLVTFTYETEPIVTPILQEFSQPIYTEPVLPVPVATEIDYTDTVLWSIYGLGVLIFGVRFLLNLVRLKRKINTAETFQERDFTLALLGKTIVPHSFFKWIFLNKTQYLNKRIAPEVLAHEATHVRQKHSVDILFIEILQVIFWFNPLIWLSKISIKLNHEFLADQGAIENKSNIAIYQNILLSYASSTHHTALESPFNYSLTKKRILMLSQSFSKKKVVLRALLLIPVIALCVLFFNQAIVAQGKKSENLAINKLQNEVDLALNGNGDFLYLDEVLSREELKTLLEINGYDKANVEVLTQLSSESLDERTTYITTVGMEVNSKFCVSFHMQEWTEITSKRGTPRYPKYEDLVRWQNTSLFKLYLDEEVINNKAILDYHPEDLPYYSVGNRSNGVYRVDIWTNPFWQNQTNTNFSNQESTYATQFIEGAKRNGKNAIIIEVKNDSIYVNGTYTSIKDLRKTIDAATANWSKEEYADPMRSIIFKGNTEAFIQRAEKEFQKTALYRANTSLRLIPPPPPAPPSPAVIGTPPPPPPPVSPKEHFVKMQKLGGVFFYEGKEISFDKAVSLAKKNEFLNIRTPYPYSKPPETYISVEPSAANSTLLQKPSASRLKMKEEYLAEMKKMNGSFFYNSNEITYKEALEYVRTDGRLFVITPIGKNNTYLSLEPLKNTTVRSISGENGWPKKSQATPAEIKTYNRLAKKYNANPTGKILQGEVIIMYEIYTKMTAKQKKNAETYPILPPPPPPPPVKVIKGVNDNDKNNPPPPALKRGVKSATQEELNVYKRLAKKYNANPTGKVLQGEVIIMYEIYTKMSAKQKKNAETYPILPPPPPPPPVKVIKGVNDGDKNNPPPPPPPSKKDGFSFNNEPKKTLSLFSKIEESQDDNVYVEVPENLSFTPSSVQTISQNIKSTQAHNKVMDSILATYNLTREDVEVKTTVVSKKEPTFDTYSLGGYSVSTGLRKDYSQEYQVTQSSSFPVKKNDYGISMTFTENVSALDHYTEKIEKHASKNGSFELDGKRISKKEALIAIQYPYIGLEQDYRTKPHNMVIKKDPITSTWDVFYNDKLLTEKEYYNLSKNLSLTLKKVKDKTATKKAIYTLEKI